MFNKKFNIIEIFIAFTLGVGITAIKFNIQNGDNIWKFDLIIVIIILATILGEKNICKMGAKK